MVQRLARAMALLLLPGALLALAADADAAYPGSNGRIAFVRALQTPSPQPDQIFTMGPDGANPVPFTSDATHESISPVWSPNGSRIAYVQNTNAGNPPFTLFVANADGSGARPVASDSEFLGAPSWSPDGVHLLFEAVHPSQGLYVVDVDSGAAPVPVPGSDNYFEGAWSPLGNEIAVSYGLSAPPLGIATIKPDGSGFQSLDSAPSGTQDRDPAWSPDGSHIYFDRGPRLFGCSSTPAVQIYSVPAAGGPLATFSQDSTISEYNPAPSPDGSAVAFTRCDDPVHDLDHVWAAAADGSSPHALTSGPASNDEAPDWQPTAPQFASAPSISGSAVNNQALTATAGSSPGGGSTSLQFERCNSVGSACQPIPGAAASHARAAASSVTYRLSSADLGHAIRVLQTQVNGLGSASALSAPTLAVKPSRGHCSNVFAGTARADRISGSGGSDKISGGRGRDRLSGRGGADCISGGAGNDRISGGSGNDKISGGSGNDHINGGSGRNTINAGSGNDTINARNHRRDVVNCGRGRDTVIADKGDKLRGCEKVRRR